MGETEEVKTETKTEAPAASLIPVEKHEVVATDHSQLMRFIGTLVEAKAIPRHLQNSLQVMSAWNFAAQLNLPPQPSLRNIAVIEGTPSLFGDLPLSLAQRHKDFEFIEEFTIDKDHNKISFENKNLTAEVFGGVCIMKRKGMKEPQSFSFTQLDADRAGLLSKAKQGMPWKAYPQIMYVRRARSMALKSLFADALCGSSIAEYDFHLAPDIVDVTHTEKKATSLAAAYGTSEDKE